VKLSKEIIEEISKLLQSGNFAVDVVNYLGIPEVTYYHWIKKAKETLSLLKEKKIKKEDLNPYQRLTLKLLKSKHRAESTGKMRHVQNIQRCAFGTDPKYDEDGNIIDKGMPPNYQASTWFLERRDYKRWGRKDYQKIDANIKTKDRIDPKDKQELIAEIKDLIGKDV
jgi:hypothetical protein